MRIKGSSMLFSCLLGSKLSRWIIMGIFMRRKFWEGIPDRQGSCEVKFRNWMQVLIFYGRNLGPSPPLHACVLHVMENLCWVKISTSEIWHCFMTPAEFQEFKVAGGYWIPSQWAPSDQNHNVSYIIVKRIQSVLLCNCYEEQQTWRRLIPNLCLWVEVREEKYFLDKPSKDSLLEWKVFGTHERWHCGRLLVHWGGSLCSVELRPTQVLVWPFYTQHCVKTTKFGMRGRSM